MPVSTQDVSIQYTHDLFYLASNTAQCRSNAGGMYTSPDFVYTPHLIKSCSKGRGAYKAAAIAAKSAPF